MQQLSMFDVIEIPLTKGCVALIDPLDSDLLQYKWCINARYAGRRQSPLLIFMHRVILERMIGRPLERNEIPDHIDGNKLNNCRSNLRIATPSQNRFNSKISPRNTSGYKGVSWDKKKCKWGAKICIGYKQKFLGYFDEPQLAHEAYKEAALKYQGEFARFE